MKRSIALMQRVVLMLWTGVLSCGTASHAEPVIKPILQRQVEHFTTGLRPYGEVFWVDNDRLVVTALDDGFKDEYTGQNRSKTKVVLVEFAKRRVTTLFHQARVLDQDRVGGVMLVDMIHGNDEDTQGACPPGKYCVDIREVSLAPDGTTSELKRWPRGKKLDYEEILPANVGAKWLNGGKSGFLVRGFEPNSELSDIPRQYREQAARQSKDDIGLPTLWFRKDKSPQPVGMRYDEINGRGLYLEFMDRYLLVDSDTSGSSSTNSHMATSAWKRPYEFTPFYLLAPDGSIEAIPYPEFIFDYGIADRHSDFWHGRNFGDLLPTRAGTLITTIRTKDSAMYLYSEGQLYQIAGHSPHFRMKPRGAADPSALSPDGCKLAYGHTNFDSVEGVLSVGGYIPPVVTIINVCGGK